MWYDTPYPMTEKEKNVALTEFEFANVIRSIAKKNKVSVDEECLVAVQQNNRMCLCVPTKKCPCIKIDENGCKCGLFVRGEE